MAPDGKWGTAMAVLGFKPKSKRKISDPIPQGDVFSVNASQLCVMNKQPRPVQVSTQFRSSTTSTLNNINHRTPTSSSSFSGSYMPMTPPTPTSFDFSGASLDPVTMAAHLAQARLATLVSDDEDRVAQHKKLSKECLNAHLAASMTMMDDVVVRVTPHTITQSKRTLESIRDGFFEYADSLGKEAQRLEMDTASCSKSLSETLLITYPAKAFASSKKRPSGIFVDNQVDLLPPSWGKSENPKPSMLQLDTPQYHPGQNIEDPYAGLEPKVLKQQIIGSFDNNSVALHRKTSHSPGQTNCSISGKEDPKALEQQSSAFFVKDSAASQLRTINDSLPTITSDPNKEVETLKPQSWQQEISHFSSSSTYSVRESGDPYQELSDSIKAPDDSKPTTAGTSSYSTPMIKSTVASAIGLKKDPFEDFDPEFITALGLTDIIPIDGRLIPRSRPLNPVADDFVPSLQRSGSRTYTVSSDEWIMVQSTPSPLSQTKVVAHGMDNVDKMIHRGVVMRILIKLYTMAKLMQIILLSYGIEVDESPDGLMFWIKRSEESMKCHEIIPLIDIVEHLYYVLYARVIIELANIELCSSVEDENTQRRAHSQTFLLPSADHLYRIVLAFKDVMDSQEICAMLKKEFVEQYQRRYIISATEIVNKKGEALFDRFGYRRFVYNIVINREGSYYLKWKSLIPFFDTIAPGVIVLLSDKYRGLDPVTTLADDIPYEELPFINQIQLGPTINEKETIQDNRLASLARLNQISIGEQRLQSPLCNSYWLAKEQKCICPATCRCSDECTNDASRYCPCAERHVRIMTTIRRHNYIGADFITCVNTAVRMHFYGLSFLKREVTEKVIMDELQAAFDTVEVLICKELHEPVPKRASPVLPASAVLPASSVLPAIPESGA